MGEAGWQFRSWWSGSSWGEILDRDNVPVAKHVHKDNAERIIRALEAEQTIAKLTAENERLRETVKGAWRFWAGTVPTMLDRGYQIIRVRADAFAEFDALFRASAAHAATSAAPAAREEGEPRAGSSGE